MIADSSELETDTAGIVSAILPHCSHGNDVLRSAAIRALAAWGGEEGAAMHDALLAAIMDEDPDVRSDAMEALERHARPEDAPVLRASVEGDPVREVKLSAIHALANLKDTDSAGLLRDLILSRCGDRVVWEDDLGDWEDWLDIQIACIQAMGDMAQTGALGDMFTALDDEFGQTLDIPVFTACASMGSDGVPWLLARIETGSDLTRKRAAQALAQAADARALLEHANAILKTPDPRLKLLVVPVLPLSDARLEALSEDANPSVRSAVLQRLAGEYPDLVYRGLTDADQGVQAAALNALELPVPADMHQPLVDNVLAWMGTANSDLASAAATILPRLAPDGCAAPLVTLATGEDRPLESRVAAVRALSETGGPDCLADLTGLLSNPAQQVRAAALHGLRRLADDGDTAAVSVLAASVSGTILPQEQRVQKRETEQDTDVTAPKGDADSGGNRVRITPEGDIVEDGKSEPGDASIPGSTLDAIQFEPLPASEPEPVAAGTPGKPGSGKRKRRAVEGPETVGDDLARVAIRIAGDFPSPQIAAAIMKRLTDADNNIRVAAWEQLARRCDANEIGKEIREAARPALGDSNPVIRLAAFQILSGDPDAELREKSLTDADALVRAFGVAMLTPDAALDHLCDDAMAVRNAALARVFQDNGDALARAAVERLQRSERIDTLAQAIRRSGPARDHAAAALCTGGLPARNALVLLEAFAKADPGRELF